MFSEHSYMHDGMSNDTRTLFYSHIGGVCFSCCCCLLSLFIQNAGPNSLQNNLFIKDQSAPTITGSLDFLDFAHEFSRLSQTPGSQASHNRSQPSDSKLQRSTYQATTLHLYKMMKLSVIAALMLLAAAVLGAELPLRKLEDHPRELSEQDRELADTAAPSSAPSEKRPPGTRVKRE
jgi:hypothetical protein